MRVSTIFVTRRESGIQEHNGVTEYTVHEGFVVFQYGDGKQDWINADDVLEMTVTTEEVDDPTLAL